MRIFHDREIVVDINIDAFWDNRLLAVYEIALASNIICKLGNPIIKENISVVIEGYLETPIKQSFESYLSDTMNQRTIIRYNCLTQCINVKIIGNSEYIRFFSNKAEINYECLLLYSKGLDSRLAYDLLNGKFKVFKVSWKEFGVSVPNSCEISPVLLDICNFTYLDTFDNDPWDDYGLYFIYLAFILNKAVRNNVIKIAIGLNRDDLFGYDIIAGKKIYSQCSQSMEFILVFREICSIYNVDLELPLKNMTRIDVCKNMIQRGIDFTESISCVFFDKIECGMCFSCFDKLSGILIALAELGKSNDVNLVKSNNVFLLRYNGVKLMTFKNDINSFVSLEKLPIDYIMLIQLNRIRLEEEMGNIMSSKYSVQNILKLLYYYSKHQIGNILFPRASELYEKNSKKYREVLGNNYENS